MSIKALSAVWCFCTLQAFAGAIVIDHSSVEAVRGYSDLRLTQAAELKWYFVHASVGDNIMDGITDLKAANPQSYLLERVRVTDSPPVSIESGKIYDYMRGNPWWQTKVDTLSDYVNNGWRYPGVDVVINKFCWIDQAADVNYYIAHTSELEAANPETSFVYVTMPLSIREDSDNVLRNSFNEALRSWVREHGRILLDIADIESYDTNGIQQTFVFGTRTYQKLFAGYTSDEGHLSFPTGRQAVALGFYALGAEIAVRKGGQLHIQLKHTDRYVEMSFDVQPGRAYIVESSPSMVPNKWQPYATIDPQATAGPIQMRIPITNSVEFYRVSVSTNR